MNLFTTCCVILVAIFSVFGALIAKKWESQESAAYNLFTIIAHPFLIPPIEPIMEQPTAVHIAHLKKITERLEMGATETGARFMGDDVWEASFGANKTRVVALSVPSTSDPRHSIPIICTCPHDADLKSSLPLVLYYFGGGLIFGSVKTELLLTRWLAAQASAVVCSIGYRVAPEFPCPTPINDAFEGSLAVLDGKVSVSDKLKVGLDSRRLATWGISAGGYMSAQMARRLTHNGRNLTCQVSLIPMAKPHGGTRSSVKYWHHASWSGPQNAFAWTSFLPNDDGTNASDWKVSLLVDPPKEILDRLAPAYIQIHSRDVLRDEGEMYAHRLARQGKLIELKEYDTSHIGALPGLSTGGPAHGSHLYALNVLRKCLFVYSGRKSSKINLD